MIHSSVLPDVGPACAREQCIGLFIHLPASPLFIQQVLIMYLRGTMLGVLDGQGQIPALQGLRSREGRQEQGDSDLYQVLRWESHLISPFDVTTLLVLSAAPFPPASFCLDPIFLMSWVTVWLQAATNAAIKLLR